MSCDEDEALWFKFSRSFKPSTDSTVRRRRTWRVLLVHHDHEDLNIDDGDGNPDNDIHQVIVGTAGAIPAITDGRLVVIVDGLWNVSTGNTMAVSSDSGLTWTQRRAQPDPAAPTLVPSWSVFDAPLTSFAGGDVVITLDPGLNGQFVGCYWFALEGTVAGAPSIAIPSSFSVASFCQRVEQELAPPGARPGGPAGRRRRCRGRLPAGSRAAPARRRAAPGGVPDLRRGAA